MRTYMCVCVMRNCAQKVPSFTTSSPPISLSLLKMPSPMNQIQKPRNSSKDNEGMKTIHDYHTSWNSSTNWSIVDGSLLNSVTFESSFASITNSDQKGHGVDDLNSIDSVHKSPLILCPISPDSTPCEITIAFAQKHEVRQIYVRSTARVYEIYFTPKPQSSNEYLCTVRCGIAFRDEEVLRAANFGEAALAHLKGSDKELYEKRLKNGSNSNLNEDDWVEVKAPDAPVLDRGSILPSNSVVNSGSAQDLYEATAEIHDANPCISITLRLLSLQNKRCVCVDEIYVFADPVDTVGSENEVSQMGNADGNSLMAMLAPTLLQLSKTAGLHCIQNEDIFGTNEKEKAQENGLKAIEPLNFTTEILQEGKPSLANQKDVDLQEAIAATIAPNRPEFPPLKGREAKTDVTCGHIERFLDQLVSRVSRVEDILLKFEENMLKPISSLDARLQRVGQQLEELAKKPKNSESPSCKSYSVPEFSCNDLDSYSPYNIGNESLCNNLYSSQEKDISSSIQLDETIYSVNATKSLPSLVVIAPDFSNADEEEDDHALETGSPKDKPKQTKSVDGALASALASFLSSTSTEPQKYTRALAVKAPEFLHEDGSIDKEVSPESHIQVTSEPCSLDTGDGVDSTIASVPSDCPLERIGKATCSLNEDDSEQTAKEVVEDCQKQDPCRGTVDFIVTPAKLEHQIVGDMGNGEVSSATSKIMVPDETDILDQFLENHIDDVSDADEERGPGNTEIKTEVNKRGPHEEFLQNFIELSYPSSVVDFETPILDVEFTSLDNSNNKSPLEALLSNMQVTDSGASCSKKCDNGSQAGEDCNLISVGEVEPAWPTTGHLSVDLADCLSSMPLNLEVENLEDHHACSNQEVWETSLI